jgi:hypothetical protein
MTTAIGFARGLTRPVGCGRDLGRRRRGSRAGDLLMDGLQLAGLDVARPEVCDKAKRQISTPGTHRAVGPGLHPQMFPPLLRILAPCRVLRDHGLDTCANGRKRVFQMRDLFLARETVGRALEQFLSNGESVKVARKPGTYQLLLDWPQFLFGLRLVHRRAGMER